MKSYGKATLEGFEGRVLIESAVLLFGTYVYLPLSSKCRFVVNTFLCFVFNKPHKTF